MKKILFASLSIALLATTGCKKDTISITSDIPKVTTEGATATHENVLRDFTDVLAIPNYQDIAAKAQALNQAVQALSASPTDANLTTAQNAWRTTRAPWEACEGYLFGPVEDNSYDPTMDSWPLDKTQLDSLLTSSNGLSLADIDALPESLKGFHAIEYVLFGEGGSRAASQITSRQMTYVASLTQSLYNTTVALRNSWDTTQAGSYGLKVKAAGHSGNTTFATKQLAFQAVVGAMAGICDEVANGKMKEPLGTSLSTADSLLSESRFSHNSTTDYTHNIEGIKNTYFCTYNGTTGHSLHELVAATNKSLDNQITTAIYDAVGSFTTISSNYEVAIYTQRNQIITQQAKINALQSLLDNELNNWILQYVRD